MTGNKYDHVRMLPVTEKTTAICAYPLPEGEIAFDMVTVIGWQVELDRDEETVLHHVLPILTYGATFEDYYAIGIIQFNGTVMWEGSCYACTESFKTCVREAIGKATH